MLQVIIVVCFLSLIAGQTTDVSQCISNEGDLPMNVYIEGCITQPCQLPQLQDVVVNMIFRAPRTILSMRTLATAYMQLGFLPIPIPYDLQEQADTCRFLVNTYCPVLETEVVVYTLRMFIESFFTVCDSEENDFLTITLSDYECDGEDFFLNRHSSVTGTAVTIEFRVVDVSTSVQQPLLCLRIPIRIVGPVDNRNANATITAE